MLKIGKYEFQEDLGTRDSCLMFFAEEEDEPASWSIDCCFLRGEFQDEEATPSICINPIETDCKSAHDLAGQKFSVDTIEECDEREDLFYIYEHEPMCCYEVEILEIKGDKALVRCSGTAVIEGSEEDCRTADFSLEAYLPIIAEVEDWEKFGL